jgi:elongator complex protein 1
MGCVDGGIEAASWSPDQEFVAVVSTVGMMMLMTRDFDPLSEVPVNNSDFGEAKPVTVGWGKRETQFRGRAGIQSHIIYPYTYYVHAHIHTYMHALRQTEDIHYSTR